MKSEILIKAAKAISYIFSPPLMPAIGVLLIFNSGTFLSYLPQEGKNLILSVVFTGTFIVPLCFVPLYLYLKVIKNVNMEEQNQRIIPYIITFVAYCCTFYLVRRIPVPIINSFVLSTCVLLFINIIILIKWKISTHMIAMGGIVGLIIGLIFRLNADMLFYLALAIIVSGVVATSRLILKAHNPKEIYSGFLLGLELVCLFVLYL